MNEISQYIRMNIAKYPFLRTLRNMFFVTLGLFGAIYLLLLLALYFKQDFLVYQNRHELDRPDFPKLKIQDIRIKTDDGETLQAWYEPPKPNMPIILFLHGNASSLRINEWRFYRMHKQGVGFLALAYRGFSQSSGKPSEKGLYIDGLAAYDWLTANGYRAQDIVIHGHSLGSGVATFVAANRPAKALILEAPFTAAVDVAAERYPYMPVRQLSKNLFLSRERIKNIHIPVLIIHGDKDDTIPFAQGVRLFELANQPKQFIKMAGSNHSTLTRDGAYSHYWKFLALPPRDFAPDIKISPQN